MENAAMATTTRKHEYRFTFGPWNISTGTDPSAIEKTAAKVKKMLDGEGLFCEIIAPRLWEHTKTIDGGYTSNSLAERRYAIERSKRCIDIGNAVGCHNVVLWLAREGTYIREAK